MELANAESVLHDNALGYAKATRAVLGRLAAAATNASALPPAPEVHASASKVPNSARPAAW